MVSGIEKTDLNSVGAEIEDICRDIVNLVKQTEVQARDAGPARSDFNAVSVRQDLLRSFQAGGK